MFVRHLGWQLFALSIEGLVESLLLFSFLSLEVTRCSFHGGVNHQAGNPEHLASVIRCVGTFVCGYVCRPFDTPANDTPYLTTPRCSQVYFPFGNWLHGVVKFLQEQPSLITEQLRISVARMVKTSNIISLLSAWLGRVRILLRATSAMSEMLHGCHRDLNCRPPKWILCYKKGQNCRSIHTPPTHGRNPWASQNDGDDGNDYWSVNQRAPEGCESQVPFPHARQRKPTWCHWLIVR